MAIVKAAVAALDGAKVPGTRPHRSPDVKLPAAERVLGNQALLRRLAATPPGEPADRPTGPTHRPAALLPQRKPAVSVPGDPLEREADAVADRVMRMAGTAAPAPAPVTRRAVVRHDDDPGDSLDGLDAAGALRAAARGGEPLPNPLRADFEARFGHDFREVRVHADAEAAEAARGLRANAYATGRDIVFAAGRYAPGTAAGQHLIAHELAHVVQQGAAPGPAGQARHTPPPGLIARDADDDEIEAIEAAKLDIQPLLDRCDALDADKRDRMITKISGHAKTTHEERQLACLLAAKFQGTIPKPDHVVMTRADFYNTYHELLDRMPPDQSNAVLDRVGKTVVGKTDYFGTGNLIDKQSINNTGMAGAPGSSIIVNKKMYVVVDAGVRFKTNDEGGPAKLNNNPGNITVDDNAPLAWSAEIGAYKGRNTFGRFAIFPSYERGRAGAIAWAKRRSSLTLLKYFEQYAPSSEKGNNPGDYADRVSEALNAKTDGTADRTTTIEAILKFKGKDGKDPMEAFVDGQEVAEGFNKADVTEVPANNAALPQEVRDFVAGFDKKTDSTHAVAHDVAKAAAAESAAAAPQQAAP